MAGFFGLDAVFQSLGRAIFMLDDQFRVIYAGASADSLLCPGASQRILGQGLKDIFKQSQHQELDQMLHALSRGQIQEGRRAFLNCPSGKTRLVSITAAPFNRQFLDISPIPANYFLVIRPAEEESLILTQASTSIGIVAESQAMMRIVHTIEALHRSDATTLITGESGTGKEVVARALHIHSPRRDHPFVAINCAAFPTELLESELFGHVRGAFTGAIRDKEGRFEHAGEGTLFLDEIGDMPLNLQVKLLRVLQEKQFSRLGETKTRNLQARLVAATNANLEQAIAQDKFREDLYYRLNVVPIHIPPLRDRPEDILPLAKHLLTKVDAHIGKTHFFSPDTLKALQNYPWPGNVRELENAMEYAATFCQGQFIQIDHLPPAISAMLKKSLAYGTPVTFEAFCPVGSSAENGAEGLPADDVLLERPKLLAVLQATHWNRGETANQLGISRTTLWRKMKKMGLE
jgi:transcriptional regulator with PAS, ATPase and Fis domain